VFARNIAHLMPLRWIMITNWQVMTAPRIIFLISQNYQKNFVTSKILPRRGWMKKLSFVVVGNTKTSRKVGTPPKSKPKQHRQVIKMLHAMKSAPAKPPQKLNLRPQHPIAHSSVGNQAKRHGMKAKKYPNDVG